MNLQEREGGRIVIDGSSQNGSESIFGKKNMYNSQYKPRVAKNAAMRTNGATESLTWVALQGRGPQLLLA